MAKGIRQKVENAEKRVKREIKEKLINAPNFLTSLRVILSFVVIYMVIDERNISWTIVVFVIAALTDFLDGQIARRWNLTTEFGRKADMIADRFLWGGTALAFIFYFTSNGMIGPWEGLQILMIMSREVISMPFALIAFFSGNAVPHARGIAKLTTFMQGFALPCWVLAVYFPNFIVWGYLTWILAIALAYTGTRSAMYYIKDIQN
ncbi:MAG: CDP-alcohol phosphatidyltransferase family protein [archaeon]